MLLDKILIFSDQAYCNVCELDAGFGLGVGEPIVDAPRTLLKAIGVQALFDLDFAVENVRCILEKQDGHCEKGAEAVDKDIFIVIDDSHVDSGHGRILGPAGGARPWVKPTHKRLAQNAQTATKTCG